MPNDPLTNLPPPRPRAGHGPRRRPCRTCERPATPDDVFCPYCRIAFDKQVRAARAARAAKADPRRQEPR